MPRALFAVVVLASCAASPWSEPPPGLPTTHGDRAVHYAPTCIVIAHSSSGALEAHGTYAALADAAQSATGRPAPRPVVLALEVDEPLPLQPVETYLERMLALHERATGVRRQVQALDTPRTDDGEEIELDPTFGARLLAFAVPRDDATIELPDALRTAGDFVVVMPTTNCIEAVADAMLDAGLEAKGASIFQRAMIAPFRGRVTGELVETIQQQIRTDLFGAVMPRDTCTEEQLASACERLGIRPERVRNAEPTGPTESELATMRHSLSRLRLAKHDTRLSAGSTATPLLVDAYCTLSYTHFVEASPVANEAFAAAAAKAGKHYTHLPWSGDVPDRSLCEALVAALPQGRRARVLVVGSTDETGPMLVAAHAFYVGGVGREAAIEAARDLEVVGALADFAKSLRPREASEASGR